jgi:mycofactocin system transcriptional regulator
MTTTVKQRSAAGRPEVTSRAEIEAAAFRLFAMHGYEGTTLDAIASEVGVTKKTLFRYYPSKHDIPWGQFDRTLGSLRAILAEMPADLPLWERVHRSLQRFNEFPQDNQVDRVTRMQLILETPALQGHSVRRYAEYRQVIAEYVANDRQLDPGDPLPDLVAQISLSIVLTAYRSWLQEPTESVPHLIDQHMAALRTYLAG